VVEATEFPGVPRENLPYLLDPLTGYPRPVGSEARERLAEGFEALRYELDAAAARDAADRLLAVDPGLHPARVLRAEAAFVEGRIRDTVAELGPVAGEVPGYTAAELLLGRAAELTDAPVEAVEAYRRAAAASPLAADRAEELLPRATEIVSNRIDAALARGRVDDAAAELARLRTWRPQGEATLQAEVAVARASGDRAAELAAVSHLALAHPEDPRYTERWGELELEVGDPGAGLELFQQLAARHPDDPEMAAKLSAAEFRWRLTQLPPKVRQAAAGAEITRGDFAVLLYWLVPSVRYGRAESGRIATDILDDSRREEIARVINLGLMRVDPELHTFSPYAPMRRGSALASLLRVAAGGSGGGGAACAEPVALAPRPSSELICSAAARCRLTASVDDCLPQATLGGGEALELVHRALDLLR
jgi:hypothetical protein